MFLEKIIMKPVLNLTAALTVVALLSSVALSSSVFASTPKPSCCTKGCCEEIGVDRTASHGKLLIFVAKATRLACKMGCCKSESVKETRWTGKRNEEVLVSKSTCTMPNGCCADSCARPVEISSLPARWIRHGKGTLFVNAGQKAPAFLQPYDSATKMTPNCCTSGQDCCATGCCRA